MPNPDSVLRDLIASSARMHPDDVAAFVANAAAKVGLDDAVFYLSDLEQRSLVALPGGATPPHRVLSIDDTPAGRAYRTERLVLEEPGDDGRQVVWFPLLDSAERIGVVGAQLDVTSADPDVLGLGEAIAGLAAELLANKSGHGDLITRTRRTQELSISAEMRWAMLPPLTYSGRNLTISGMLEPAYDIAGDTFSYALNGDVAHLAIIDAVGHGLEAARIANLAVIAYRHARRRGLGMEASYRWMDEVMTDQFESEKFATAQLATLTISTGALRWLNAGHPAPMIIRGDDRIDLEAEICLPVGLGGTDVAVATTQLEANDLVLFFTDGVTEARSVTGVEFGRDRLAATFARAAAALETPAETVRLLGHAILDHQRGRLQDDASLLLLAWHGPPAAVSL